MHLKKILSLNLTLCRCTQLPALYLILYVLQLFYIFNKIEISISFIFIKSKENSVAPVFGTSLRNYVINISQENKQTLDKVQL